VPIEARKDVKMKRLLFVLGLVGFLSLTSCDNELSDSCIEIRVIENVCGMSAVQVVDGSFPGDLITWTNYDNQTYENVFGTFIDPCLIDEFNGTFFIELVDEQIRSQCAVCLALPANMPENYYHIKQVADCSEIGDL